jgi:hypothetical protein
MSGLNGIVAAQAALEALDHTDLLIEAKRLLQENHELKQQKQVRSPEAVLSTPRPKAFAGFGYADMKFTDVAR